MSGCSPSVDVHNADVSLPSVRRSAVERSRPPSQALTRSRGQWNTLPSRYTFAVDAHASEPSPTPHSRDEHIADAPHPDTHAATRLLGEIGSGDGEAAKRLLPIIYSQLRALAGNYFRGQPGDHTLQATALVHEAFLRLIDQSAGAFRDRSHFFAVAAVAMRQILTDHARRVGAAKRGGGRRRLDVAVCDPAERAGGAGGAGAIDAIDILALDEALSELAALDSRKHRVVELRYFGGLSVEDVAEVIGVSKRTVESDWRAARAWLGARLGGLTNGA